MVENYLNIEAIKKAFGNSKVASVYPIFSNGPRMDMSITPPPVISSNVIAALAKISGSRGILFRLQDGRDVSVSVYPDRDDDSFPEPERFFSVTDALSKLIPKY